MKKNDMLLNPSVRAGVAILVGMASGTNPAFAHSTSSELREYEAADYPELAPYSYEPRSSVHFDMVRALARCAGFTENNATIIAEISQSIDGAGYYGDENFGTRDGENNDAMHFANIKFDSEVPVESRYTTGSDIDPALDGIKNWARGEDELESPVNTLVDPDDNLWPQCYDDVSYDGQCCDSSDDPNSDSCIFPGSIQALGAALHSIADAYSHKACGDYGGHGHQMYPDHPGPNDATPYCQSNMNHGNEFGGIFCTGDSCDDHGYSYDSVAGRYEYIADASPNSLLVNNTEKGIRAMRDYIVEWRATQGKGVCDGSNHISNDEIHDFVGEASFKDRMDNASSLYDDCDKPKGQNGCGPLDQW